MNEQDFNWTDKPVIGFCLLDAERDSNGNVIEAYIYYRVGKHKETGMMAILPTEKNMKDIFVNALLKRSAKFN